MVFILKDMADLTEEEYKKVLAERDQYKSKLEIAQKELSKKSTNYTTDATSDFNAFSLNFQAINDRVDKTISDMGDALLNPFDDKLFDDLNKSAVEIQSTFGLSRSRLDEFKTTIADVGPELTKIGLSQEDFVSTITGAMEGLGTSASLGTEAIVELAAASKFTTKDVTTLASNFRDVGISVYDVGDRMKEVADYARSVGVSVKAVSDGVVTNLEKMNIYNFIGKPC